MSKVEADVETVLQWWERAERRDPDALAVSDETTSLTRSELGRRSEELAAVLTSCGVR